LVRSRFRAVKGGLGVGRDGPLNYENRAYIIFRLLLTAL
jgi:hypothetical protein